MDCFQGIQIPSSRWVHWRHHQVGWSLWTDSSGGLQHCFLSWFEHIVYVAASNSQVGAASQLFFTWAQAQAGASFCVLYRWTTHFQCVQQGLIKICVGKKEVKVFSCWSSCFSLTKTESYVLGKIRFPCNGRSVIPRDETSGDADDLDKCPNTFVGWILLWLSAIWDLLNQISMSSGQTPTTPHPPTVQGPRGARHVDILQPVGGHPTFAKCDVRWHPQGVQRPTLSYFVLLFHACPTLSCFFEKCPTLSYFLGFFSKIS